MEGLAVTPLSLLCFLWKIHLDRLGFYLFAVPRRPTTPNIQKRLLREGEVLEKWSHKGQGPHPFSFPQYARGVGNIQTLEKTSHLRIKTLLSEKPTFSRAHRGPTTAEMKSSALSPYPKEGGSGQGRVTTNRAGMESEAEGPENRWDVKGVCQILLETS